MNYKINQIKNIMDAIEYGFKDKSGKNIMSHNPKKWNKEFPQFYYLQAPVELMKTKCGVCWDQVELERKLFQDQAIECKTYFIYLKANNALPSHTFLTYEHNKKHYWFEHAWEKYKGIHEYQNEIELLVDVKEKFIKENNDKKENRFLYIYEYQKPKEHITCDEFYKYIESQKRIKINND